MKKISMASPPATESRRKHGHHIPMLRANMDGGLGQASAVFLKALATTSEATGGMPLPVLRFYQAAKPCELVATTLYTLSSSEGMLVIITVNPEEPVRIWPELTSSLQNSKPNQQRTRTRSSFLSESVSATIHS